VIFQNRFLSPQEMASLVCSADIYVTPYRYEAQAVSGTLAYGPGRRKSDYFDAITGHAAELLNNGRGTLVPFEIQPRSPKRQSSCWTTMLRAIRWAKTRLTSISRPMCVNQVAHSYMRTFVSSLLESHANLHEWRFPSQTIGEVLQIGATRSLTLRSPPSSPEVNDERRCSFDALSYERWAAQ